MPGMLQHTSSNQPVKCPSDLSWELINTKSRENWEDHEHNLRIIQIKLISRVHSSLINRENTKQIFISVKNLILKYQRQQTGLQHCSGHLK